MTSNQNPQFDSLAIVVRCEHPLAFRLIEQAVASDPDLRCTVISHADATVPSPAQQRCIFIVDTHSVKRWMDSLLQLHSRGHRSIVLVSDEVENTSELRGLFLGAHGIVNMSALADDLPKAVRAVSEGRLWISRATLDEYVKRTNAVFSKFSLRNRRFTLREDHVVKFLVRGFSNKLIAKTLAISERTVKFHVSNIMRKLNIQSRRELLSLEEITDSIWSGTFSHDPVRQESHSDAFSNAKSLLGHKPDSRSRVA